MIFSGLRKGGGEQKEGGCIVRHLADRLLNCAAVALLGWTLSSGPRVLADGATVQTLSGRISGVTLSRGITVFKGIPFAAPPVGNLRWRPPSPPAPWRGVLRANHYGPPCMQGVVSHRMGPWTRAFLSERPASENCLSLNVWTPALVPQARRPVLVWIYGGGFVSGAASVPIYDGEALARKGVVVVSFNYRVGPFGFLAYPALTKESSHHSSGNYALLDQIAALKWVARNIANFGGNPRRVTIFGQSAGASSVWLLMQSPLAEGLFKRAIIMSGPAVIPFPGITGRMPLAAAEQEGERFASKLGAHSLRQLRALPPARILEASQGLPWEPIRDGWVLRSGWHPAHQVTVINGMVADDIGIGYYGNGLPPAVTLQNYQQKLFTLCRAKIAECLKLYPARRNGQAAQALRAALRDRARASLWKWAERQSRLSPKVYLYYFDRKIPWPEHPQYGVFHSSELPYVFDNLSLLRRPWQPVDWRIAKEMSAYWTNFALRGSPNGAGLPKWPRFQGQTLAIMRLGARMEPMAISQANRSQFWLKNLEKPLGF